MADALRSEKILVITPSPALRALLELSLEEEGLEGVFYEKAQQGLEFLKNHTPRAIVLDDVVEIDPFSIATRLKMSRRLREVPVVLLLSDNDDRTKLTAEFTRVEHVLSKPLDRKAFAQILRSLPQQQPIQR
ncbi:response regulator [Meiothermus sp. QL-1]|uniref:response regulator n=1 Tax=Meiothermus sp. QL-1 TaxID=2058095 RepID=UPI000E0A79FF|nr:response regulator [Meiothermus sp. QL-1]RDI96507.1 response regulator [Meiothermus sp. QL-1]